MPFARVRSFTFRVVRNIESSRRDGKSNGRFSNFRVPNACKIELRAFREAGTFIRVDGEMRRLPAYFDNPVLCSAYWAFSCSLLFQGSPPLSPTFTLYFI